MVQNIWDGFQKSLTPMAATMRSVVPGQSSKGGDMRYRFLALTAVAAVLTANFAAVSHINAQTQSIPAPHLADGQPDLNGTWDHGGLDFVRTQNLGGGSVCILDCPQPAAANGQRGGAQTVRGPGNFPKYKPEFLAKVKDLSDRQVQTDTVLQCQPPGVPRIGPPQKIVQNAREVVFLYDDVNGGFFRIVPTDGRPHRKDVSSSYLGDATGHWEGDTLVVETTNFNEDTWLIDNGAFHTKELKVVERLRRVGNAIEYQAVAYDPAVLAEPWTSRPQTLRLSDRELDEPDRCEDRDLDHVIDGSHHDNLR
jgi:hypothetical protein